MSIQLNHTIVLAHDQERSARFLTEILGRPEARRWGHFLAVELDNGVTLDVDQSEAAITPQHYAFLVGESDFDAIFTRIRERALDYWADPGRRHPETINHHNGGRGLYFLDPNGHLLELLTRP